MTRIAHLVRERAQRKTVEPTMVMIDAQTVRGGRAGPTFHDAGGRGGRTIGAKRSILIEYLGLPLAVKVDPARPQSGFAPLAPRYKVEHAFARLGRWRRLSRCYEGTEASRLARGGLPRVPVRAAAGDSDLTATAAD